MNQKGYLEYVYIIKNFMFIQATMYCQEAIMGWVNRWDGEEMVLLQITGEKSSLKVQLENQK